MKINITLQNCSDEIISITKEPEAVEAYIAKSEEIKIQTNCEEDNIAINIGKNEDGTIYVQVLDALNTRYIIYKDGENLFEEYL